MTRFALSFTPLVPAPLLWGFGALALAVVLLGLFGRRRGTLLRALGFALLLLLGAESPYWVALPAFVLMPAGMGTGIPAMTGAMLGSVDRSVSGVASAVTNAARQAGGAMGVAVFGTLAGTDLVGGMHAAALVSIALILLMAGVAWAFVPARAER